MSYTEWKDKTAAFKTIDVRGIQGNFFQGIKKQAMELLAGNGLEIIQNFDPIPLYEVMEGLGYEHFTKQKGTAEFHTYFYRTEVKQEEKDIPMRPAALTNMPLIDEKLVDQIKINWLYWVKLLPMISHRAYTSNDRLLDQRLLHQNICKFCLQVPAWNSLGFPSASALSSC